MHELLKSPALAVIRRLETGEISPLDLLDLLETRIGAVDGAVNALPRLCFDRARSHARHLMERPLAERGPLKGLPIPIKDLTDVAGVETTYGSPIFKGHVPEASDILVERIEANGGLVYAKSNTPEFGAGGNTFNEVYGATRNPWNLSRSAAGSSGGAAAALAAGMAWLAHGSDMGGSLRNPASFCGIVGLRPSPGRVAMNPGTRIDESLSVEGPMARNVEDVAFLLDCMSGEDWRDPISLPKPGRSFLQDARSGWTPRKVAYSHGLGFMPCDPEVAAITRAAAQRFTEAGVIVEEAHPDFTDMHWAFRVLRARSYAAGFAEIFADPAKRALLKPEVIWNIEIGLKLTGEEVAQAELARFRMFKSTVSFFKTYDLILSPATIVAAFPVEERWVKRVNGHEFANYVEWLGIAYALTMMCCPALSLPAGFTRDGLPVGLQIAAPPHGEGRLLAAARLLEASLDLSSMLPIEPKQAQKS